MGTDEVYCRGEHRYGRSLLSRAERHLTSEDLANGISKRELNELRRFQSEVLGNPDLPNEIFAGSPPDKEDPQWLTAMQHYDDGFGTRLLDLTRSIFAGFHFATISWRGDIIEDVDGLLYLFIRKNKPWRTDSYDLLANPSSNDDRSLDAAYSGWPASGYFRLYQSETTVTPRELAQDGLFLVRGDITSKPNYGQVLKIRIPGRAKPRVARELWFAGFTPRRIVRGVKGVEAHKKVASKLGLTD